MIDFTFPPDVEKVRQRVREFMTTVVKPAEGDLTIERHDPEGRRRLIVTILQLREKAKEWGLWLPHMPAEFGGMGLGPTAMAAVSAESARTSLGSFVLNCQAPDEGNMHTLLHFGTPEQKEQYLRPLCDGVQRSCFAMTEPEVAGSDPTLIQTHAVKDGDHWVVNGHKWFIRGARGGELRDPDRQDRPRRGPAAGAQHGLHRRPDLPRAGRWCATSRRWRAVTITARSASRTCVCPIPPSWAAAGRDIASARSGSAPRDWRTACGGSDRWRRRSRC